MFDDRMNEHLVWGKLDLDKIKNDVSTHGLIIPICHQIESWGIDKILDKHVRVNQKFRLKKAFSEFAKLSSPTPLPAECGCNACAVRFFLFGYFLTDFNRSCDFFHALIVSFSLAQCVSDFSTILTNYIGAPTYCLHGAS